MKALVLEKRVSVEEAIAMFGTMCPGDSICTFETIDGITNVYGISPDPSEHDPMLVTVRWSQYYGYRTSAPAQLELEVADGWRSIDEDLETERSLDFDGAENPLSGHWTQEDWEAHQCDKHHIDCECPRCV